MSITFPFDNTYARLPERFFARLSPTPVKAPRLIRVNDALAARLGLNPELLNSEEGAEVLAGNRVVETPSRLPPRTRGISSACSCRNSATAARYFSAS